jgi:hypothetical protein
MSTKKKVTKPKAKTKPAEKATPVELDIAYWQTIVPSLLPKEDDKWRVGEVATALHLFTKSLAEGWQEINRIASRSGDKVAISVNIKLDRNVEPPNVKVKLSFSEKHNLQRESDAPDPEQAEMFKEKEVSEPREMEQSVPDPDEPARVRSSDEKDENG